MHCAVGLQGDLYQVWPGIGFELLVKLLCLPLHFNIFDLSRRNQEHVGLRQGHFAKSPYSRAYKDHLELRRNFSVALQDSTPLPPMLPPLARGFVST